MKDYSLNDDISQLKRSADNINARESFVSTGKLPFSLFIRKGFKSLCTDPIFSVVKNLTGAMGFKIRQIWYKRSLGSISNECIIDVGVNFSQPSNVFLGKFVYIDQYCQLISPKGYIKIGRRCHIAQFCVILGHGEVEIGDFVAIASGTKIFSISEWPGNGMRICGPMIPMSQRGLREGKITIKNEAFIGANSVIMPGITIGEGAVVGANSVVYKDVEPWTVVTGNPPKLIGKREMVTQPDPDLI
jgi:acetyltransferase-like isoleucine patch superfamily enzyme